MSHISDLEKLLSVALRKRNALNELIRCLEGLLEAAKRLETLDGEFSGLLRTLTEEPEQPKEHPEPETEQPKEHSEPETEQFGEDTEPETEQPKEHSEPETEQFGEDTEPETEQPKEHPEPETEQPKEHSEPETEQFGEDTEPETEQPKEHSEPETEQFGENTEPKVESRPNPGCMPRENRELDVVHTSANSVSNVVFSTSQAQGPLSRDRLNELMEMLESMILHGVISDLSDKDENVRRDIMKVHTLQIMVKIMQWKKLSATDQDVVDNNPGLQELIEKRPERKMESSDEPKRDHHPKHIRLWGRFRKEMGTYEEKKKAGESPKLGMRVRELDTLIREGLITEEEFNQAKEILKEQNALV